MHGLLAASADLVVFANVRKSEDVEGDTGCLVYLFIADAGVLLSTEEPIKVTLSNAVALAQVRTVTRLGSVSFSFDLFPPARWVTT